MIKIVVGGLFLLLLGLFVFVTIRDQRAEVRRDRRNLEGFRSTFKVKTGAIMGLGSYSLLSVDGGKTWYDTRVTSDGYVLNGRVEEIRPGLLEKIQAFDALTDHVTKHGPINLSGPGTTEGMELLQDAGFSIENAEQEQ